MKQNSLSSVKIWKKKCYHPYRFLGKAFPFSCRGNLFSFFKKCIHLLLLFGLHPAILRGSSWWCSGNHTGCQGENPGSQHTRQTSYLLCHPSCSRNLYYYSLKIRWQLTICQTFKEIKLIFTKNYLFKVPYKQKQTFNN